MELFVRRPTPTGRRHSSSSPQDSKRHRTNRRRPYLGCPGICGHPLYAGWWWRGL